MTPSTGAPPPPLRVVLSNPAAHDLRRLDRQTAERVIAALSRLAESDVGDVKKLKGQEDRWRLRVGDWRVIFTRDDSGREIIVLAVASRGAAYR